MSADPLRVTNNNNNNNIGMNKGDKFNHILFSHHDNTKASTRLSLLSVYFQAFAYYDSILTAAAFPLQLLIFIYKYNILYYDSNYTDVIAGQLILLVLAYGMNWWRLELGASGNKGKKYANMIGYMVLSVIVIVGFFYIIAIQANILWLQFITFLIVIIIALIGTLISLHSPRIHTNDRTRYLLSRKLNMMIIKQDQLQLNLLVSSLLDEQEQVNQSKQDEWTKRSKKKKECFCIEIYKLRQNCQ